MLVQAINVYETVFSLNYFCIVKVSESNTIFQSALLHSPIALHRRGSIGAVEVWHLLVIVNWEDSPNYILTLSHKTWLIVVLKLAHTGCRLG